MNNHSSTINSSSAAANFWPQLKDLSNNDKLDLIVLLSSSMTHEAEEAARAQTGWTKSFAGRWQDDRTAEEIIEDIRASRNANFRNIAL